MGKTSPQKGAADAKSQSEEAAAQNQADGASQNGDQKTYLADKSRVSVINLTDSSVNSNHTLNTTSPPNPAIRSESNKNGSNDENSDHNKSSNGSVTFATDPTTENGDYADITSKPTNSEPVARASKSMRHSEQKDEKQTELNVDGLPSESFLGTQPESAPKLMKRKSDMTEDPSPVKRTVKFRSPIVMERQNYDADATYDTGSYKCNDSAQSEDSNVGPAVSAAISSGNQNDADEQEHLPIEESFKVLFILLH